MNFTLAGLFEWLLTTSIMGSVLVLFIFAVRYVLRNRLRPRWTYLLWLLLIVRLLLPWTPESSFSIYNVISIERFSTAQTSQPQEARSEARAALSPSDSTTTAATEQSNTSQLPETSLIADADQLTAAHHPAGYIESGGISLSVMHMFSILWLVGFIVVISLITYVNLRFTKSIKQEGYVTDERLQQLFITCKQMVGIKRRISLIRTNKVPIATLSGIRSPKLLLPDIIIDSLTDEELKHLFLHELSHVKRGDIAINGLMNTLLAMHWFNPLLWYAYHKMREDQELACDARALSYIPAEKSHAYAFTLIKLLEIVPSRSTLANTASISSGKKELQRRIVMIKSFKKQTYSSTLLGIAVILMLSSCALTSPKVNTDPPAPVEAPNQQLAADESLTEQADADERLSEEADINEQLAEQIEQLAKVWAEALKTRDGEPRYKMMSEHAQHKFEQEQIARAGEDWNFNIGYSSPWVVDYQIDIDGSTATITYTTKTSEPAYYSTQETVYFKQEGDMLVVEDYETVYEARS